MVKKKQPIVEISTEHEFVIKIKIPREVCKELGLNLKGSKVTSSKKQSKKGG